MRELSVGDKLKSLNNEDIIVQKKLGSGGQGDVYKVKFRGKDCALKWYDLTKMSNPREFYDHIKENLEIGNPCRGFLWPKAMTAWDNEEFGYVMELIPPSYVSFAQVLNDEDSEFSSTITQIDAAMNLVEVFGHLHQIGCSYQDINEGNIFFNLNNGDVLVCDTDNVSKFGRNFGIAGTMGYMAPEVVRRQERPNTNTDLFSLAVALYVFFLYDHPLDGIQREKMIADNGGFLDDGVRTRLYGTEPSFIFDDRSNNRPSPVLNSISIDYYDRFPGFMKEAFQKSFSRGSLMNGTGRLLDSDWLYILAQLKSSLVKCPSCGEESYIDEDISFCHECNCQLDSVGRIIVDNGLFQVPIVDGGHLYANGDGLYSKEVGLIERVGNTFFLNNTSEESFITKRGSGTEMIVPRGATVGLKDRLTIKFGTNVFKIDMR